MIHKICKDIFRSVIRRQLRRKVGYGHRLKPQVDKIPKYVLPKSLKRYIAYEPCPMSCKFRYY